jgi:rhodanese-related sulfurtransferase
MKHASAFLNLVTEAMPRIREIGPEETAALQKRGDEFLLIDVREDNEWAAGHIQDAVHIGKGVIERDIERAVPEKNTKLVLYCGGGYRSALAADALQKMGYTDVYSLAEGWKGWVSRGFPRV